MYMPLEVSEKAGDRIGHYKLLQKLGEGGCGVVYMAEQEEPVKRHVALKVVKLGMDTQEVVARFEAERQALALMDHSNIAKVLDGGATAAGRPFFVMELVRGIPITKYCDEHRLDTKQRLELFIMVCQAIQHAHQKGIIHRDIKPSNILVADHDGTAVPKVIDFGIAKATSGQTLTDKTLFTAFEQFIGTPAYMSPEQAKLSGLDIDTRSDIYSLGVLLYELLTGKTPFDSKQLVRAGLDEIRRIIQQEEPPRPSTRLSTLEAAEQTTLAHQRQTEPSKLTALVRGDLDWIVMKALEKDRNRRYETSNGLAMDVQRYLSDEPVLARPPSRVYRLQKLIWRNKLVFGAGSAVVLSLIIGLGMSGWFLNRETIQRRIAEGERNRAAAAQHKAEAAERLAAMRADQLRQALSLWHSGVTNLSQTEAFFQQTLQMQRKSSGGDSMEQVPTLQDLANIQEMQGKQAEATATWRRACQLQRKYLGEEDPALLSSLGELGLLLQRQDKLQEAEDTFRLALPPLRQRAAAKPSEASHILGIVLHHLADVLRKEKSPMEALALAQEAVSLYARHSEWPANERAHAQQVLVDVMEGAGDSSAARKLEDQIRQVRDLTNMGRYHARVGEWQKAATELTQVIELDPSSHWNFFFLAPLLIQNDDISGYQKLCLAMLTHFGDTAVPTIAERVSKVCLLLPSGVSDGELAKVDKLSQLAVETGQNSQWLHWFEMTRGLAEYRQGRFTNAVQWTQRVQGHIRQAQDDEREVCEADSYLVLAMAQNRLRDSQAAQAALAHGVDLVQTRLPKLDSGDLGLSWHDVLIAQILMREAQALIERPPDPGGKESK